MIKKIHSTLITQMEQNAASSPRLRSHYNFHPAVSDAVNRLCIYLKKGTYIRPHRHSELHRWEVIIALKGEICIAIYNNDGQIIDKFVIAPNSSMLGFEIAPNTWHSLYAVTDDAMFFEVKPGPFAPTSELDFAKWAPKERDACVQNFLQWLEIAKVGDQYNPFTE